MIILRLFRNADPPQDLGIRAMADGELAIGRDAGADWTLPDVTKTLSRRHCVLGLADGVLTLRDDSTNGVFRADGRAFPKGEPTGLAPGETFVLGAFLIRVEIAQAEPAPRKPRPAATAADGAAAGRLLDAFCGGAEIDSSVLSAEDPIEVMQRLGAIYRQMVLGLGALMNERTRAKAKYGLQWTTVQALDNNPFRWAPAQRMVVDLLQSPQEGFLDGESAVKASYDDLHDHQRRLLAGTRAAIEAVLTDLAPDALAEAAKGQAFVIKKRADILWTEYAHAHRRAWDDLHGWVGGSTSRAFAAAYMADGVQGAPAADDPPTADLGPARPAATRAAAS